jgi:hypothetical protein
VSLINDALRKARQATSEHEANQPETAFRPAKAYPSRRSGRSGGPLAAALIAVAAAVIGAAAAWWYLGNRQTPPTEPGTSEARAADDAEHAAPLMTPPTPVANRTVSESRDSTADDVPTPMDVHPTESVAAARIQPGNSPTEPAVPLAATGGPVTDPNRGRVFVLEAELGYASLSLGYIVARRDNPFAEINGKEVRVGSEIEGFVVEAIETDRVILRDARGPLVLRVP